MNLKQSLLVFITPFSPRKCFNNLKASNQKMIISSVSIFCILSILLVLHYMIYTSSPHHLSFSFQGIFFSFGFVFKILLIGTVTAIIASRSFKQPMSPEDTIAIISVSSLPLILGMISHYITGQPNQVMAILGTVIFGIIASFGISEFYGSKYCKSLLVIFGIILTVKFLETTLFGIPKSY